MNADIIVVIKEGEILEKGNHEQLLKLKGKYYQLWSKQMKKEGSKSQSENPKDLPFVNDLSPKFREEVLKKALEKTGARFHDTDQKSPVEERQDKERATASVLGSSVSAPISTVKDRIMELASHSLQQPDTYTIPKTVGVHTNVTFAAEQLKPLSKSPQSHPRPLNNMRTLAGQGILKNTETIKSAERQSLPPSRPVTPRTPSSLKPDAREFVPNEPPSRKYNIRVSSTDPATNSFSAHRGSKGEGPPGATLGVAALNNLSADDRHIKTDTRSEDLGGVSEREKQKSHAEKIQTLQERIGEALKSSEAKVKEMEEGKMAQELLKKDMSSETRKSPTAYIRIPGGEASRQDPIDTETSPISLTESQNELLSEPKKRRRRNRRRNNKSRSSEDSNGPTTADSHDRLSGASLDESACLPSMRNISPHPENDGSLPNMDGEGTGSPAATDKKPKRRFRNGSKVLSPKAEVGKVEDGEPSSRLRQTVSADGLSRRFKGKGRANSADETSYRAIPKEDLGREASDSGHISALPEPAGSTVPFSPTANGNTLREPGRRKSWGKSTTKSSWRKPDKGERREGPDPSQAMDSTSVS